MIGDWMQTAIGRQAWPLDPRDADFRSIEEIAFVLAGKTRFNGHAGFARTHDMYEHRYSVGQHSVLVSLLVPPEDALWGLLHEGDEFLLPDMPAPLKRVPEMAWYRELCRRHQDCMCRAHGLPLEEPASVKHADLVMLATEKRDLMVDEPAPWRPLPEPDPRRIVVWSPAKVRVAFLQRYRQILDPLYHVLCEPGFW